MHRHEINMWAYWDNSCWVDRLMAGIIMVFDMFHVDTCRDSWLLIEITNIPVQMGIIDYSADITFEMPDINSIKPD